MGLFDLFRRTNAAPTSKSERDVVRWGKLVGDKLSQNLDRQDAIARLGQLGTADAARALLRRFSWSFDPSIVDQEEKQSAAEGIAAAGEAALGPIREYCRQAESLTWPLKVLRTLLTGERLQAELLELLSAFDQEYMRNPEPKKQLVVALEEFPGATARDAVTPFLEDVSEPVRFSAAQTLFAVGDASTVAPLMDTWKREESLRVKNRILQGLAEVGWTLTEEQQGWVEAQRGDYVVREGRVQRR